MFWLILGSMPAAFGLLLLGLMVNMYRADQRATARLRQHVPRPAGRVPVRALLLREGADRLPMYPTGTRGRQRRQQEAAQVRCGSA